MFRRFRTFAATLAAVALLVGGALPASAGSLDDIDANSVPVVWDIVVMRPLGLVATAAGAVLFVPAGAVTALFHRDSVKPVFNKLVRGPYEFTFVDPIGTHGDDRNF